MPSLSKTGVTLASNGDYWQAAWYDSRGRRCRKSLGSKHEYSKRDAGALCRELAVEHAVQPSRKDRRQAPSLEEWLKRYPTLRTDVRESTLVLHAETGAYLTRFFDPQLAIDRVTRSAATDWRHWMTRQPARPRKGEKDDPKAPRLSEASVCRHVRAAKTIFAFAVDEDRIPLNPFDRLKGTPAQHEAEFELVDRAALDKILEQCPDDGWKCLFALCRLAGLRQGEALRLRWSDVDWHARTLTILPSADEQGRRRTTTKQRRRDVPIEPRLYEILDECFHDAADGAELVCPVPLNNLHRQATKIVKRAGLEPYADPFHALRKNLESEWLALHPLLDVVKWLGHSPTVAAKHYHKPTADSVAKVTGAAAEPVAG
jgi:integrase